ncbi:MAG: NlpC/P60 family protein [Blautia sp.]|uniref:C40 family peptidase n=1 Tax=Blautia sp. TaxID=1955243 RepID=UPI002A816390|nr:NlpC/P60 family protein [Blautia sp.]MDY4054007.1 NlpC/P60 family protein [Blautia sp.]
MDKRAKARLPSGSKLRWEREGTENTLRGEREQKTDKSSDSIVSKKAQRKQIQKEAATKKKKESAKTRQEAESAAKRKGKLKFENADGKKPDKPGRKVIHAPADMASVKVHQLVHASNEDNNTGVQSAEFAEGAGETSLHVASNAKYSHKLHKYKKAERLEKKADKTQIEELFQKSLKENPEAASNVFSRWRQKQEIKKEYAAMKAGKSEAQAAYRTGSTVTSRVKKEFEDLTAKAFQYVTEHSHIIIVILGAALLILLISGMLSSCSALLGGSGNAVIGTSYTAEDDDILGAEADYRAMEEELRRQIREMQEDDDYDDFELHVDEIGHNPWELASLLTVLYEDYSRREVQRMLRQLFEAQYSFSSSASVETVTETRTVRVGESLGTVTTSGYCNCRICCGQWSGGPTASGVYPTANHTLAVDASNPFVPMGTKVVMNGVEYKVEDTGNFARYGVQFDVYYDSHIAASLHGHKQWECFLADDNGSNTVDVTTTTTQRVLNITATNHTLTSVIANMDLTVEERERYQLLLQTKGNKPYLFEDDIYSNPTSDYLHYDIPGEALTDAKFAKMIHEAEKYLGYPYVWGGSSPSTSFDCSGFVSWVINNCGNGWNVGRQTAEGLRGCCDIIQRSQAKPGDLIFFQGTYDTPGASHVGIYVGNGMMIHCGNPISYASIETSYWQQHFFCFGRIR